MVVSRAEDAPWPGQRTPVLSGDLDATGYGAARHRLPASVVSAPAVREAGSAETHRGREAICGKREKNGKANVRWSAGRRHCRAVFWRWRKGGERSRNFWSAGNAVAAMIPCRGRVRRGGAGKRGSGCLTAGVGELLGDLLRRAFDDRLDR